MAAKLEVLREKLAVEPIIGCSYTTETSATGHDTLDSATVDYIEL
jgi:hypothetical protein